MFNFLTLLIQWHAHIYCKARAVDAASWEVHLNRVLLIVRKFASRTLSKNALTMPSTHFTIAFDKVNIHSTIPRQHNSAQQRCVKLELVNVISMILFPHDLITPDADCTPCTPSLPRTRMKGHVYLLFVNTNTFGMPISCRRKLKRPRTPWLSNDALKPDQGQSP